MRTDFGVHVVGPWGRHPEDNPPVSSLYSTRSTSSGAEFSHCSAGARCSRQPYPQGPAMSKHRLAYPERPPRAAPTSPRAQARARNVGDPMRSRLPRVDPPRVSSRFAAAFAMWCGSPRVKGVAAAEWRARTLNPGNMTSGPLITPKWWKPWGRLLLGWP